MPHRKLRQILPLLISMFAAACSSDAGGPSIPTAPTITISGVAEGNSYAAPIAIVISVDRGSFTATLNDQPFTSGQQISQPGSYTLAVTAREGSAASNKSVRFTVTGASAGATGVTLIRLINLGANDSGGGGDAILITDSTNGGVHHALVDAGPAGLNGSDLAFVANRIKALGVDSLDFVMLTHAHSDHYQGLTSVLQTKKVRRFIYNGQIRTSVSGYQTVLTAARAAVGQDSMIVPTSTRTYRLGSDSAALVTIVPPLPTYLAQDTDDGDLLNEGSVGMQLRRGTFEMFFTGDGEVQATQRWRTTFAALTQNIDVLKVGHHGANNAIFDNGFSGTSTWLAHTNPQVSVISANGTTHPRVAALNALLSRTNMKTYCTNVHGDIVIRVTGTGAFTVTTEKAQNSVCVPGSAATT